MGLIDRSKRAWQSLFSIDSTVTDEPGPGPRKPAMGEMAFANALTRIFSDPEKMWVQYNPSALVKRKSIEIYSQMARDDQVKAALMFKRYACLASGWEIKAPDGKDRKTWEPAVEVDRQFRELDATVEHALDEILSATTYGFSVTEKIWREGAKYIELQTLKTRHPFAIDFEMDGYGNIGSIRQMMKPLPIEKFLIFVNNGKFGNPYGESDIEAAYRAWWIKDNSYKWMAMLLERMGIPPIFALYDPNALSGQVNTLKSVLSKMQAATVGAIPRPTKDSLEFWSPELADNVAKIFIPALKQFNEDIARSVLLPGLLGFTPDAAAGSRARSAVSFDAFLIVIERMRSFLAIQINRTVVRDQCDFNWPDEEFASGRPEFALLPLSDDVKDNLFELWMEAVANNVVTPGKADEEHIRNALKFPEHGGEPMPPPPGTLDPTGKIKGPAAPVPPDQKMFAMKKTPKELQAEADAAADKAMKDAENHAVADASEAISESRDVLLGAVRKSTIDQKFIDSIKLRKMGDVQQAFRESMRGAFDSGRLSVLQIASIEQAIKFIPKAALAYLESKSIMLSGDISDQLTSAVKRILLDSIKNGELLGDTIIKLGHSFDVYLGEDGVKAGRLETIARTNITDAYNQGRLKQSMDPEVAKFMFGMRYSAILDNRTTKVCQFLDGKIFRMDDPELLRLTPPNHFNCRSILVPITKTSADEQGLTSKDYITKQESAEAANLAGTGFYALDKPCGCYVAE